MAHKDGTKSGGRKVGTPNRTASARHAASARVNEALAALGEDTLTGMKLLKEVLNHPETPLDVKIQCAGLLIKHEVPAAEEHRYVVHMPTPCPGDTQREQLGAWWALHSGKENNDPEWQAACNRVLELAVHKQKPETL